MNAQQAMVTIPDKEQIIAVELTVKELMALSGSRFHQDQQLLPSVRKKLRDHLQREWISRITE
ncbi:Uncharacterised protein [Chlamydia abortus]|jgi:hypothetical protein|uniref:Uncharacterized protein n=1 Tax=Paenibacillus residui TaxID=629724 RepID=A0ABW3DBD3_9BACL|nr:hypothetical protein [Paenibacillus sp. 32O-W]SHE13900.1 Uncharacterised protein [Chlamydia abortus]